MRVKLTLHIPDNISFSLLSISFILSVEFFTYISFIPNPKQESHGSHRYFKQQKLIKSPIQYQIQSVLTIKYKILKQKVSKSVNFYHNTNPILLFQYL